MKKLSIIVPTLNEAENVGPLTRRIDASLQGTVDTYEIIFVDDNSSDGTENAIAGLSTQFPTRFVQKKGPRGKAFSLLEGFTLAQYDTICMIDADQQYPPEAIGPMYDMLEKNDVDIVLTEREEQKTSFLRKLSSKVFNFVFTKMLFGFDYDSQSGLKLFKKHVVDTIKLDPTPWSFDLEFIVRSLEKDYRILSYKIPFDERAYGETKVRVLKLTYELSKASLKLRASSSPKKVRRSYRRSMQLSNKALSLLIAPAIIFSLALFTQSKDASALAVQAKNPVSSITDDILSPILGNNDNSDSSKNDSNDSSNKKSDSSKSNKSTKKSTDSDTKSNSNSANTNSKSGTKQKVQNSTSRQPDTASAKSSSSKNSENDKPASAKLNNKADQASSKPRDMYADKPDQSPIPNQAIGAVFIAMGAAVAGLAVTYKFIRPSEA